MRLRHTAVAVVLAAGPLLGCAGAKSSQLVPAPLPVGVAIQETEEGGRLVDHCGCAYTFADINSQLRLTPRLDSSAAAALRGQPTTGDTLGLALRALADSLATLRATLAGLESVASVSHRIATAVAAGDREQLRTLLAQHASLVLPALDYVKSVDPAAEEALLAKPDETYGLLASFLRSRVERMAQRMDEAARAAREETTEQGLFFRVWAVLYSPRRDPVQVHVDGYDNLPRGDPNPVPKLGFARTPAEQEDLDRAAKEYGRLIETLDTLRRTSTGIGQDLGKLLGDARLTLSRGRQAFAALPRPAELTEIARALPSGANALRDSLRALATALDPIEPLRTFVEDAAHRFQSLPSPQSAFDQFGGGLSQVVGAFKQVSDAAGNLRREQIARLRDLGDRVVAAATQSRAALTASTQDQIAALAERIRSDWAPAVAALDTLVQHAQEFSQKIDAIRQVGEAFGLTGEIARARVAPQPTELLAVPVADAHPGTLDLTRIGPRDGDRVIVTLQVVRQAQPLRDVEHTVRVRTYGWHRSWQTGLAFTRESRANGVLPGVALSWTVHHRSRPKPKAGEPPKDGATLLGGLDLGLGLTSIAITQGSNLQLGFGPTVSLFGDALVFGGGLNFERQKGFLLFATPLLDLARRVVTAAQLARY